MFCIENAPWLDLPISYRYSYEIIPIPKYQNALKPLLLGYTVPSYSKRSFTVSLLLLYI